MNKIAHGLYVADSKIIIIFHTNWMVWPRYILEYAFKTHFMIYETSLVFTGDCLITAKQTRAPLLIRKLPIFIMRGAFTAWGRRARISFTTLLIYIEASSTGYQLPGSFPKVRSVIAEMMDGLLHNYYLRNLLHILSEVLFF